MYYDELNQLVNLRNLIGNVTGDVVVISRPTMDLLGTKSTSTTAVSMTYQQAIGYARMLEDLSVQAFAGAAVYLTGTNLAYATQIMATNGYHAGALRLISIQNNIPYISTGFLTTTAAGAQSLNTYSASADNDPLFVLPECCSHQRSHHRERHFGNRYSPGRAHHRVCPVGERSRAALARLCLCCWAQPNSTRQPTRAASSRSGSVVPSTSIPTSSPWRWRDPLGSFDRAGEQQKAHILSRMWAFYCCQLFIVARCGLFTAASGSPQYVVASPTGVDPVFNEVEETRFPEES
jgi:hypothetical protein